MNGAVNGSLGHRSDRVRNPLLNQTRYFSAVVLEAHSNLSTIAYPGEEQGLHAYPGELVYRCRDRPAGVFQVVKSQSKFSTPLTRVIGFEPERGAGCRAVVE